MNWSDIGMDRGKVGGLIEIENVATRGIPKNQEGFRVQGGNQRQSHPPRNAPLLDHRASLKEMNSPMEDGGREEEMKT